MKWLIYVINQTYNNILKSLKVIKKPSKEAWVLHRQSAFIKREAHALLIK
jgi:hypothetical protein